MKKFQAAVWVRQGRGGITITDPTALEKPWTFTFAYQRMKDYTLLEYICEDNREFSDDQGRQKIRVDPAPR